MKYTKYNSTQFEAHSIIFNIIKNHAKVLDLGCATGYFAKELKIKKCIITGVDIEKSSLKIAKQYCNNVILGDLDNPIKINISNEKYDVILLVDVIEHLKYPIKLLKWCKQYLKPNGIIIISTPNIAHLSIRLQLLFGKFNYTEYGILDATHLHFYTIESLTDMLQDTKLNITKKYYSSDFGQLPFIGRIIKKIPKKIQYNITSALPSLLGIQLIWVCEIVP